MISLGCQYLTEMKLLAWDTSTTSGAVVAAEWDATAKDPRATFRIVAEWHLSLETAVHSERLLWAIHQVLKACAWDLASVDVFGVGVGPGSFTGLRIGVTTARQLAHTLGKPLVPVSSLALLVRPAARMIANENVLVCATRPSAKGEVFAIWGRPAGLLECVVRADGDRAGIWSKGVECRATEPSVVLGAIAARLKRERGLKWTWMTDVADKEAYRHEGFEAQMVTELAEKRRVPLPPGSQFGVQGRELGLMVWEAVQQQAAREALAVRPSYDRDSEAEVKLRKGELKRAAVE